MSSTILLDYAGPHPASRPSLMSRIIRAVGFILLLTVFTVIVIIRGALLAAGYACVFAGTLFLFIGGRRSAAVTLKRWRGFWMDHLRLWWSDLVRPLRRARPPRKVVALLPA